MLLKYFFREMFRILLSSMGIWVASYQRMAYGILKPILETGDTMIIIFIMGI